MEISPRTPKSLWVILLAAALAAFSLGFALSYQDEQMRFNEMGSLAQLHLTYALELKDDMSLIDWSKGLEKLQSVLAFQAHLNSKVAAEGGNGMLCPVVAGDGLSFSFPYRWTFHSSFSVASTPADLTLVFQDFRGPFFWAVCFLVVTWVTGWLFIRLSFQKEHFHPVPPSSAPAAQASLNTAPLKTIIPSVDEKSFTLALDQDYMICQVTSLAAQALDRQESDLIGSHFLDLLPDPAVMEAIEASHEIKLSKPFPSHPHLSAWIRPASGGTILVFESKIPSQMPQNRPI